MPKYCTLRRARGYLLLLHPGPSAVCTTVTALAGWSVWNRTRHLPRAAGAQGRPIANLACATAAMALAQFSTGVLNDAFDAPWDRVYQQYKPIATGDVPRHHAWVIGFACGIGSLGLASLAGSRAQLVMLWGLVSGWSYSLGLSRTPLSFLPFASGLASVPLLGPAAVGVPLPSEGQVVILAGGLGLGLHLANAGPDIERDRQAGRKSLPVMLGTNGSRAASQLLLSLVAAMVALGSPPASRPWTWGGTATCAALILTDNFGPPSLRSRTGHPFVVPALAGGSLAVGWLLGRAREMVRASA